MILVAALLMGHAAPARARPYRDERRGFALELPKGWRLAPQFGQTEAMVFERRFSVRRGGRRAALSIRRVNADVVDQQVQEELHRVWGKSVGSAPRLAPPPNMKTAWSRRYRPSSDVDAEAHLLSTGTTRFLVALNASPRDLRRFRSDVRRLISSFRPLGAASPTPRPVPPARPLRRAPQLVGHWVRNDGASLIFDADGTYTLADVTAPYAFKEGRLHLTDAEGYVQRFEILQEGDRLELRATALSAALVFQRFRPRVALAGVWVARLSKGNLLLKLGSDGRFALGAHQGKWSVRNTRLILEKSKTEVIAYTWTLSGRILILTGGDLDTPLRLAKREH